MCSTRDQKHACQKMRCRRVILMSSETTSHHPPMSRWRRAPSRARGIHAQALSKILAREILAEGLCESELGAQQHDGPPRAVGAGPCKIHHALVWRGDGSTWIEACRAGSLMSGAHRWGTFRPEERGAVSGELTGGGVDSARVHEAQGGPVFEQAILRLCSTVVLSFRPCAPEIGRAHV